MRRTLIFFSIGLTVFSLMTVAGLVKAVQVLGRQAAPVVQAQSVVFLPLPTETTQPTPNTEPSPTQVMYSVTADQATQLGSLAAGFDETLAATPEMVNFNGIVAFEVLFADNNKIYIDASNGSVLYNSLTGGDTSSVSQDQAIQIAQQFTGDGRVYSLKQGIYQNQLVYEIRFANNDRAHVNARGEIVYVFFDWSAPNAPQSQSSSAQSNPSHSSHDDGEHD